MGDHNSAIGHRLGRARMPQIDAEATRLRSKARAALFGGEARVSLARYQLGDVLGRGGLGIVYRARDPDLDRDVALKVVRPDANASGEQALAMLVREARAIASLSHPNVVAVYDTGRVGDEVFIAMELVHGQTLNAWLAQGRAWPEVRDVLLQAGRGLAHAHAAGLVHRDFKPGNVMVGHDGRVRVLDFGLAKALQAAPDPGRPGAALEGSNVAGTPAYMAPEQFMGEAVDARADQFAFCVVAFEALYGHRPFRAGSLHELGDKLDRGRIDAAGDGSLAPPRVDAAVRRGLARAPGDRWPSMTGLLDAIARQAGWRWQWWIPVLALGAGTAVASRGDAEEPPCSADRPELARAWSPERAAAGEAAFERTGLSYAPTSWERVSSGLDDYRDRWSSTYRQVCAEAVATPDAEQQAQRMRCLEHRLTTLRAFVELLEDADPRLVAEAARAVRGLPDVDVCLGGAALESSFPRADTAATLAAFERIEARLAESISHNLAGRYELSYHAAEDALAQAEDVGSPALAARAAFHLASGARGRGDLQAAAEHMSAAFWVAMGSRADTAAVDAAVTLVEMFGHDLARFDEADRWARQARALLPRAQDPPVREAWLESALAKIDMSRGRLDDAHAHLSRALQLAEQHQPDEIVYLGFLHALLATVVEGRGQFDDARAEYGRGIDLLERGLGPGHPEVGNARANFGVLLHRSGDSDAAVRELRAGVAVLDAAIPDHSMAGTAHNNLGLVLMQIGRNDEASEHLEASLRVVEGSMPPTHPYVAMLRANLGILADRRGDAAAGREYLSRALVILKEALGPEDPALARTTVAWADLERGDGNDEMAIELYERTIELLDGVPGHNGTRAQAEFGLAQVLVRAATVDRARRHATRARSELAAAAFDQTTGPLRNRVDGWLAAHSGL